MPNKMLIDASHPEETRVVVVRGNRIEEFDFESQDKKQLKGNIYLARVTRVEPSLQAAFVEYGGNRHGFLAFSEIHPDYYQIPVADRQALLKAEAEAAQEEDEDDDEERGNGGRSRRNRRRGGRARGRSSDARHASEDGETENGDDAESSADGDAEDDAPETAGDDEARGGAAIAAAADADTVSEPAPASDGEDADDGDDHDDAGDDTESSENGDNGDGGARESGSRGRASGNGGDDDVVSVGAEDALEEIRERRRPVRRHYKIQEVIKRRQILLVQVVKEERGNKGAALTTYLSLAGRYSVLMPNTARGGGISRKITSAQDRKRLKDVVRELEVPQGMGVILRTAGESRTKAEIKRDYEYLMRMWDNVRELTLRSTAPALVYEEGSLIKRSVRDLYNKDIDEILVSGEDGYREAKDFMRMLMPSHAKMVQPYRDPTPILARSGIEAQLDRMVQPQVTLKSGGYIIINQTEALVAIDVNSGRSTKEHSIEDTALQTNLEAAEEVARQLRLRDLAGLIVIDFIDMEENRNNRAVEKKLKDCLKNDRARIQVGRISHFGLLEMSRQRIRASVLDSTMQPCPHCGGAGHVRSDSSVALLVIRAIEEFLLKDSRHHITVRTPTATAIYVLNHKRSTLADLETRFGLTISVEADETVRAQNYAIFKGAAVDRVAHPQPPLAPAFYEEPEEEDEPVEVEEDVEEREAEESPQPREARSEQDGDGQRKRRRRRRRRGGRDRDQQSNGDQTEDQSASDDQENAGEEPVADGADEAEGDQQPKKRRRGKRGGRRNRRDDAGDDTTSPMAAEADSAEGDAPEGATEHAPSSETIDDVAMAAVESGATPVEATPAEAVTGEEAAVEKPKRARRPSRKKTTEPEVAEAAADLSEATETAESTEPVKPKRASRRKPKATEEPADAEVVSAEPEAAVEDAPTPAAAATEAPADTVSEAPASETAEPANEAAPEAADEGRPRRTGWWQRRGFF